MVPFIAVLVSILLPTALAVPHHAYQPSGANSFAASTGGLPAPYGHFNTTAAGATGTGTAPVLPSTITIVPLPVSVTSGPSENSAESSPLDNVTTRKSLVSESPVESPPVVHVNTGSPSAVVNEVDTCGPATVTVTSADTVTVTVQASATSSHPALTPPVHVAVPLPSSVSSNSETPAIAPSAASKHRSHHHGAYHRSASAISSSSSSSIPVVISETPVASSSPAAEDTTRPAPPFPHSSTTQSSSSTPAITSSVYHAAPVLIESPPSSSPAILPTSSAPVFHAASVSVASQSTPSAPSPSEAAKPKVAAVVASSTPSSAGTKRGLVYNTAALTHSFADSPAISWCYNWDSQPGGDIPAQFNFVPMMWGPIEVHTANWKANADNAIAAGATHLLGFNEPDLASQANLTPQQAADSWRTYMEPYAGQAKLGSPAVCNGGGLTGLNWLTSFFDACSGCTVDFVAIHWYGLANEQGVADFKDHTTKAIAAANGKPVWITEFKPDGSPDEMASFMTQILAFLDSCPGVERYSYFQVDAILVSGDGALTGLGGTYAQ